MFSMTQQKCRIANYNARTETHGDKPAPAADIKLEMKLANDDLAKLDPRLKETLYFFDKSRAEEKGTKDIVDEANQHDPNYMPHLRFPRLCYPLKYDEELVGANVTIHYGTTGQSDIELTEVQVNEFKFTPMDGGTVELSCRVQCHPSEAQAGKLFMINGSEFAVTIEPPSVE